MSDLLEFQGIEPELEVRSESERLIGIRFMKYGEIGRTAEGLEVFEPGAFAGTDASRVVIRMEHEGPPAGRGVSLEEREDSAVIVAKAAGTPRGDELLTLAKEGYFRGASPSFLEVEGGTSHKYIGKERVTVRKRVDLREISPTWRPTYAGTEVLFARTQQLEDSPVTEAAMPEEPRASGIEQAFDPQTLVDIRNSLATLEERSSTPTNVTVPNPPEPQKLPPRGEWLKGALSMMDGQQLSPVQERALADTISTENPGFVPPFYSNEIIGIIEQFRPFMQTTRRIDMPENGMSIVYPRITQRPTVAEQTTQKTEVSSTNVESDTITRNVRTFAGAGDLSLQLLRRSSPEFLNAYLELLAEAYADVTENAAVDALLAASPTAGTGTFDVAEPQFGEAVENGIAAGRRLRPDHMWLSTTALTQMINALTPTGGGGTPMYPNLINVSGVTNTGGSGPVPISLTPVWTPALDDEAVDIIIGPSAGFAWAEEGTFTLQADVPGRLGRDVALGGFVVFVDLYPAAFTTYVVAT